MKTLIYCLKCHKKQEVEDPEMVTLKNGGKAFKTKCPVCGTGMFKFCTKAEKEAEK